MKIVILLIAASVCLLGVASVKVDKSTNINVWGKTNCLPNPAVREVGFSDRWWAKSKTGTGCKSRSYSECEAKEGCFKGEIYDYKCQKKAGTTATCTGTEKATCIATKDCQWVKKPEKTKGCLSRCAGCYFVTTTPSSVYQKFTEKVGGKDYYIASESYDDDAGKYLVRDCVCKGNC